MPAPTGRQLAQSLREADEVTALRRRIEREIHEADKAALLAEARELGLIGQEPSWTGNESIRDEFRGDR